MLQPVYASLFYAPRAAVACISGSHRPSRPARRGFHIYDERVNANIGAPLLAFFASLFVRPVSFVRRFSVRL